MAPIALDTLSMSFSPSKALLVIKTPATMTETPYWSIAMPFISIDNASWSNMSFNNLAQGRALNIRHYNRANLPFSFFNPYCRPLMRCSSTTLALLAAAKIGIINLYL